MFIILFFKLLYYVYIIVILNCPDNLMSALSSETGRLPLSSSVKHVKFCAIVLIYSIGNLLLLPKLFAWWKNVVQVCTLG